MGEQASVYVFRHPAFAPAGDTVVCVAPLDLVTSVYGDGGPGDDRGLFAAFGGGAFFRDDETGSRYVGVWGARNASRFRTALRTRATLKIVRAPPPGRLVFYEQGTLARPRDRLGRPG